MVRAPHNSTEKLLELKCRLTSRVAHALESEGDLADILSLAAELEGVEGLWIWTWNEVGSDLALPAQEGLSGEEIALLIYPPPGWPLLKNLQLGSGSVGEFARDWAPWHPALQAQGWNDAALWPIWGHGQILGALGAWSSLPGQFQGSLELVLGSLAKELGGLLARLRTGDAVPRPRTIPSNHQELEREQLITAIEQSADSIVITDASGAIQYANPAFCQLTGWSREAVLGGNPRILKSGVHTEDFYRDMWRTLVRGGVWKGRITNRKKDGDLFTEWATLSPVRDKSGVITHYVGVKRDITDEITLEQRMRQSHKMEALGMLAGGLAHDFNNILYAIMGYCQLALDDVPEESPVHQSLREIAKAGGRAANLVTRMLALGARSEIEFKTFDLREVLEEAMDLARASIPTTVTLERDFPEGQYGVFADPTQIHQVVLNLCQNAQYAMRDGGGILRVALETVECELPKPGRYHQLSFTDGGTGMSPDILEKIFEPYFTTKDAHEGSGLGLATVQGIVLNHHGQIAVESVPRQGTTFTLHLPEAALPESAGPKASPPVEKVEGQGRIVLVDDEEMVVKVTCQGLERAGFTTIGFLDSRDAWEAIAEDPAGFDLLITDQVMPHLTGEELASKVLTIRPDLPIILVTGYGDHSDNAEDLGLNFDLVLAKPLQIRKIAEHAKALLSRYNQKVEV
jgi:PAS domain S-box-containing protein